MNKAELSVRDAYYAMIVFLENIQKMTDDESLAITLGSMQLMNDGMPADPAYWKDWERAVESVLNKRR